jgi:hypothetical protein
MVLDLKKFSQPRPTTLPPQASWLSLCILYSFVSKTLQEYRGQMQNKTKAGLNVENICKRDSGILFASQMHRISYDLHLCIQSAKRLDDSQT